MSVDLEARWSDVQFDGVGRVRRDPRFSETQDVQLVVADNVMYQCERKMLASTCLYSFYACFFTVEPGFLHEGVEIVCSEWKSFVDDSDWLSMNLMLACQE